jgi:ribulose-5-phosphate 4-epimerase/fuculose-1-phosphate aldolase
MNAGFSERFIHSEIYKAYPDVHATVHSHSLAVIPFSISSQPLAACFHMAGFLGCRVPVWDIDSVYTAEDQRSMLVRSTRIGASLAQALGHTGAGGRGEPQYPVVLMRGHGMVVTAERIEMVVLRCIYTAQNARVQQSAMGLGGTVKLFTEREATDTRETTAMGAVKPWPLWKREVENSTLYQNLA